MSNYGVAGFPCPPGLAQCGTGQCLPAHSWCDFSRDCPDGSDEAHCGAPRECRPHEFRCKNGQCIPDQEVCISGHSSSPQWIGCKDNSHLIPCKDFACGPGLFKCRNSYCVNETVVCDGLYDCKTTLTDEEHCGYFCPDPDVSGPCFCEDEEMDCEDRQLRQIPDTSWERGLTTFHLSGNFLNETLSQETFVTLSALKYLDLSRNHLTHIDTSLFSYLWRLSILNLAYNNITRLQNGTFFGLISLDTIYLQGNEIQHIEKMAFTGLSSLNMLDLSYQQLGKLEEDSFIGLRQLYKLNLSHNALRYLQDGTFNGLNKLMTLDVSGNAVSVIDDHVFNGLLNLQHLITDEYRFCCLATFVAQCEPAPDEFSSCEDLMSNTVLRLSIWVLGVVSLGGNVLVIFWRLKDSRDSKVHSFLITNLAIGDMLMGVYLLIIAGVDIKYRGVYIVHSALWRRSALCQFAGFLSTFSSELSVLTLTVITIDRLISIIFPFKLKRLGHKGAHVVMAGLWLVVLLLAALPLLPPHAHSYFADFYGRSGVCLALHITPDRHPGWEYSVFVFLGINFLSISTIAGAYVWMFVVARRTRLAVRSAEQKKDHAMARRMTLIVLTDFLCWMPIILLGLASFSGATIPSQVYAWIAVFILPLNAAVNPLLYTMSTTTFLAHTRRRASRFRQSLSSLAATQDTRLSHDDHSFEKPRYFPIPGKANRFQGHNHVAIPLKGVNSDKNGRKKWRTTRPIQHQHIQEDHFSKIDYTSMYD